MKWTVMIGLLIPFTLSGQGIINNGYITFSSSPHVVIKDGGLNNNGTWTKATETVVFTGTSASELKGVATTYHNLQVSNTAGITLNTALLTICNNLQIDNSSIFNISPTGKLTVSNVLTNNGGVAGLNILSDPSGNGSLIHSTAGVNATVQEILLDPQVTYYHAFSSPITNATALVMKFTGSGPYLYDYVPTNSAGNKWYNIIPSSTPLIVGKGYLINFQTTSVDRTPVFAGPLNTGDIPSSVVFGGDNNNLVGNPYPCAIDWDVNDGAGWTRTNISPSIYIWNPAAAGGSGLYGTYLKGGGSVNGVTNIISSGQGYFVKTTAGSAVLQVDNRVKVHSNSIIKSGSIIYPYIKLKLTSTDGTSSDESIIRFHPEGTVLLDNQLEAFKFFSMSAVTSEIYSQTADSVKLAINSLPENWKDSIPIYFKCRLDGDFKLSLIESTVTDSVKLYDMVTNKTADLTKEGHSFIGTKGEKELRFIINRKDHSSGSLRNDVLTNGEKEILFRVNDKILYITSKSANPFEGILQVYDISGKVIMSEKVDFTSQFQTGFYYTGVFIAKLATNDKIYTGKIISY